MKSSCQVRYRSPSGRPLLCASATIRDGEGMSPHIMWLKQDGSYTGVRVNAGSFTEPDFVRRRSFLLAGEGEGNRTLGQGPLGWAWLSTTPAEHITNSELGGHPGRSEPATDGSETLDGFPKPSTINVFPPHVLSP